MFLYRGRAAAGPKPAQAILWLLMVTALAATVACGGLGQSPPGAGEPNTPPTPATPSPPTVPTDITAVNHIVVMLQENRSFDSHFGKLGEYKAQFGFGSASDVDGLPAGASNSTDDGTVITSFKFRTGCIENVSPDWLESWGDMNLQNPGSRTYLGNGYVHNGQGMAKSSGLVLETTNAQGQVNLVPGPVPGKSPNETTNYYLFANNGTDPIAVVQVKVDDPNTRVKTPSAPNITPPAGVTFTATPTTVKLGEMVTLQWSVPGASQVMINTWFDQKGRRAMGYYDWNELPYHYFMAANFATSDRFFSPMPGNSEPNRAYIYSATTHGQAHDPGQFDSNTVKNIFQLLDEAGISWRLYYHKKDPTTGQPATRLARYKPYFDTVVNTPKLALANQFFQDVQADNLPQVIFIEELSGFDEHPGGTLQGDIHSGNHVQAGAQFAAKFINALMGTAAAPGKYWKDSVFFMTYDEGGGLYDHVSPQPATHPDGLAPTDLQPKDAVIQPPGNFDITGFRVPLMVVSPFAKKNFVSHTVMDYTAILKFIETRFKLPSLTKRDAAQPDMTEFFNFASPPWATPPTPPDQPVTLPCDYTRLP